MARPILKKGMAGKKGTDIGESILLWRLFLGKPELKPSAGVTSYDFGAATDKFTKEFQKSVGLPATGIVDANTWATYDSRMSTATPVVKAVAKAVETQSEANKAAAMAAAVKAKTPTPKPQPSAVKPATVPAAFTPATVKLAVQTKAKEAADAVKTAATTIQAKHAELPGWKKVLSAGLLGLAGLVGYKAVKSK